MPMQVGRFLLKNNRFIENTQCLKIRKKILGEVTTFVYTLCLGRGGEDLPWRSDYMHLHNFQKHDVK